MDLGIDRPMKTFIGLILVGFVALSVNAAPYIISPTNDPGVAGQALFSTGVRDYHYWDYSTNAAASNATVVVGSSSISVTTNSVNSYTPNWSSGMSNWLYGLQNNITNYTIQATNDLASYARTLASQSTNYTVTASNSLNLQITNVYVNVGGNGGTTNVSGNSILYTVVPGGGGTPSSAGVDILINTSAVYTVNWNTNATNVASLNATNGSVVGFVGNGLVYSNVNGLVTLNGSLQATNIITSVAFTSPTNTSTDGYVLTATGTGGTGATAWKIAGGGGGTGIQTNAGTGQFNIFTNATMVQNTNGGVPLSVVQSLTSTTNAEVIYSAQPGFIATYDLQSNLFGVFGMQTNQGTGLSTGILLTNQTQGQWLNWRTNGNFSVSGIDQGSFLYATNAGFKAGWLVNPTGTNTQVTEWNTNSGGVNLTNTFVMGSLGTDNINLQSANTNGVATFQVGQDGIAWGNAAGLTNYAYLIPTNNAGGNAMVSGSPGVAATYYDTNFTVNTTLAAMSFWANGVSSIFIHATVSGGTDRTLTFPGGCNSLQWGTPAVITVTNGQGAEIEVRSKYGSWTNVFWSPTAK